MDRHLLNLGEDTCRRRTSAKWQHYAEDVLPLWVAEMDVLPAPPVAEELLRVVRDGDLGYPVEEHYLEAVARWYTRLGATVDPARMRIAPDAMSGVRGAVVALTDPGDPVYITVPVYPPFHTVAAATGRRLVTVPLGDDGRYDAAALDETFAATPGRGVLLLSNPHNPTGAVATSDELSAVGRVAARHGVAVVSDEVHAPLVLPGAQFTSFLSVPEGAGAFAVISPAKGWNLAGLKAAAVVGGSEAGPAVEQLPPELAYSASHVGVRAHVAAMDHGQDWLADLVEDLDANRTLLRALLAEHLPGVRWGTHEATYLAWLDCRELELGHDPAAHFRDEGRVALNSGLPFGAGHGHVRLNFAASPAVLTEAVTRMARSLGRGVA